MRSRDAPGNAAPRLVVLYFSFSAWRALARARGRGGQKFVDVPGRRRGLFQRVEKFIGESERGEQPGKARKTGSARVFKTPERGNAHAAFPGQIVLPPRQGQPVRAYRFACAQKNVGFVFKR